MTRALQATGLLTLFDTADGVSEALDVTEARRRPCRGREACGCLVAPAVFNTDVAGHLGQAGSIPVRLRHPGRSAVRVTEGCASVPVRLRTAPGGSVAGNACSVGS